MKNKALKMLSLALVAGIVSCASLGAMAANVSTTTTYTWGAEDTADVTVNTSVTDVVAGTQVTYYVAKGEQIVYIDQKAATAEGADFQFVAAQGDLYGEVDACAQLSLGSNAGIAFDKFKFVNGSNLITNGTPTVTETSVTLEEGYGAVAKVSGNITEYGFTVDGTDYRAYGCTNDGVYAVTFEGVTETPAMEAYAR